ncbi:hypothetical protein CTM97_18605 [Photobacterium phosphoreum]|uniref:Restriction endonuclease type IV Mrr domain-containing protein n=1 Tax=Photobacterium phosphoreum TaxID=659 RepID=A0A2T3JTI0_PHOPO|nr:restriction endonuclease [Photobacterium phosphoreum]PSU19829.1 hypothetical protein CTM96_20760 [Photobacterium phosphoreum]PSU38600.1 hypothetical protein CTM97_18605 [Photobacterium phosphoreum]PSU52474.1 hypothetical protein C9J18_10055 [Photobacterium phosphoreum]
MVFSTVISLGTSLLVLAASLRRQKKFKQRVRRNSYNKKSTSKAAKPKSDKHKRNIEMADKVILRLAEIEYDGQRINYLKKINPYVFEEFVLTMFEVDGYKIKRSESYSGDGGYDGEVFRKPVSSNRIFTTRMERILVQSKHIKRDHVNGFILLCAKEKCPGYFVHCGKTPLELFHHALKHNVRIISGYALLRMINRTINIRVTKK